MMAHMLGAMSAVARYIALALLVSTACAPATLTATALEGTTAPDFTLTDGLSGHSVSLSALRGSVVALAFLYTTCPDVGPLTASNFRAAQRALGGDAGAVTFVAVSVDPDRDTPKATQDFSAAHDLRDNWRYLIGGRAQLAPVWAAYGIASSAGSGAATVAHNDAIYLIDRRGRERTLLHSDRSASDLAADLRILVGER